MRRILQVLQSLNCELNFVKLVLLIDLRGGGGGGGGIVPPGALQT